MKNNIVKTIKTEVITDVDIETGEVINQSVKEVKIVVNSDSFALIYANFWNALIESPLSKSDIQLLAYLIKHYSDGTPFSINSFIKTKLAEQAGTSVSSYNNSTRRLLKYDLIYSPNNSRTYIINPTYAFKGSSSNRKKAIITMITE